MHTYERRKTRQAGCCVVRVQRRYSSLVPRIPAHQEIQGFRSSHLANQDAVGSHPQRRAHESYSLPGSCDIAGRFCRALDLSSVLDDNDPPIGKLCCHLVDQPVCQCRFSAPVPPITRIFDEHWSAVRERKQNHARTSDFDWPRCSDVADRERKPSGPTTSGSPDHIG